MYGTHSPTRDLKIKQMKSAVDLQIIRSNKKLH